MVKVNRKKTAASVRRGTPVADPPRYSLYPFDGGSSMLTVNSFPPL
jgi:hypothetical protein